MGDDLELLRQFTEQGSEVGFSELVHRHVNFVYGCAQRHLHGDAHAAADVTQYVFVQLAIQACRLGHVGLLKGWLHTTTRNAAANFIRTESRRRAREREAHEIMNINQPAPSTVETVSMNLAIEDALSDLGSEERDILLRRFFEGQTFAQIGTARSLSEDAVRRRTSSALEQMAAFLGRRGITSTAGALGAALTAHAATSAPDGLASSVAAGSRLPVPKPASRMVARFVAAGAIAAAVLMLLVVTRSELDPESEAVARKTITLPMRLERSGEGAGQDSAANPDDDEPRPAVNPSEIRFRHRSFTFARVVYSSRGTRQSWSVDYPEADVMFSARFAKVTGLKTNPNGEVVGLTDPLLKTFPFIYIVEGADMTLAEAEATALREYLLGGGFLLIDDFWGEIGWRSVAHVMKKVFPNRDPVDLSLDHPIFNCFYEIREKPQIPNPGVIEFYGNHRTWELDDAKEPHYRGLFDDTGRLMAVLCHNTDLGDGWEGGGSDYYQKEFGRKKALPMGINIVVYALSR